MKEAIGHCGVEGRRARADIRKAIKGPKTVFGSSLQSATTHVENCPCCTHKISHSIVNNPLTTYGDSLRQTLDLAMQGKTKQLPKTKIVQTPVPPDDSYSRLLQYANSLPAGLPLEEVNKHLQDFQRGIVTR